MNNIFSIWK